MVADCRGSLAQVGIKEAMDAVNGKSAANIHKLQSSTAPTNDIAANTYVAMPHSAGNEEAFAEY